MTRPYKPINLSKLKTYSISRRSHKARVSDVGSMTGPGASAKELIASFPAYLGAQAFSKVVSAVARAARYDRPVVMAFGAHVLKVGCGPIVCDLIKRGVVKAIACNGACVIHDAELAFFGETSEEVADTIKDGSFGMVEETMAFFKDAVAHAERAECGLGQAVGQVLSAKNAPYCDRSVFVAAYEAGIPATVHVALGTDTVHVATDIDGAALGEASMFDFRLICDVVADLGASDTPDVGGVWLNVGSAVILPEVFLKAVSVARNLGANLDAMSTANFDMIRHYRPGQNVVTRPVAKGRGFEVVGHHEIMLPLLRQGVIEELAEVS